MDRTLRVELTNMCLIEDGKGQVLLQRRVKHDWPGLTLPGGHVEKGENLIQAVKREIREETGLAILRPRLVGIMEFKTLQGQDDYLTFLYKATSFTGKVVDSREGKLGWYRIDEVPSDQWAMDMDGILEVYGGRGTDLLFEKGANGTYLRQLV